MNIAIGTTRTRTVTVDEARSIALEGDALRVYATSAMVRDIELASRDLIAEFSAPGENSVGARMEIDHLGPALLDASVDITVRVVQVDRRRVEFEAEARDAFELIGRARHVRFVVDLAKQRERLAAKAARQNLEPTRR